MRLKYCAALMLSFLLGIALSQAISGGEAYAAGLSMELDIQQESFRPLVPIAQHFETCFTTDPVTGLQILSLCAKQAQRLPASQPKKSQDKNSRHGYERR